MFENVRRLGLISFMGTVGDCFANAPQGVVLGLDASRATRPTALADQPELAVAIADYSEHFYDPARRHSALGYLTPNEFENVHSPQPQAMLP